MKHDSALAPWQTEVKMAGRIIPLDIEGADTNKT